MKKMIVILLKVVVFFIGWAILASIIGIPSVSPVVWRFWAEFIPFAVMAAFSFLFWIMEKKKVPVIQWRDPLKNVWIGTVLGCIWIGIPVIVLRVMGVISFGERNSIPMLWLWAISCLLNVFMQELLVRGYIYQLLKHNYSAATAVIVTTLLFTALHGGAFEEGAIPVLCVLTMSVFMSLVMEYTGSLAAPIILHFIWNFVGAILFNVIGLAEDYPHLLNTTFSGSRLLTGGRGMMEGSVIVLVLNVVLCVGFGGLLLKKRRSEHGSLQ